MGETVNGARGALVISLDFELLWGVRDLYPRDGGAYRPNLVGARTAIPRLLDLFEEYGLAATWATVGFLFAATRTELERHRPIVLPSYADPRLDPYRDPPGAGEADDPLCYAASLIAQIKRRPRQEIASHTYSHYYCLEPGHDRESLRQDLASAVAIARDHGISLRSLVFPRNQYNPAYADVLAGAGFTCCRTNAAGWVYRESAAGRYRRVDVRAGRLVDSYISLTGPQVTRWSDLQGSGPLCCLPASHFLRPYVPRQRHLEPLRLRRIAAGMREAAVTGGVFHLWWHPHNFGVHTDENLAFLRQVLDVYRVYRDRYGLASLSMAEVAEAAGAIRPLAAA